MAPVYWAGFSYAAQSLDQLLVFKEVFKDAQGETYDRLLRSFPSPIGHHLMAHGSIAAQAVLGRPLHALYRLEILLTENR
ncbi:hypothetical protein AWB75_04470 [Caballeronia catudaia]|uniref:Uncharacterized protein n=1 Tax=Caballeronia catudaia TaxID=1777136 RepID=A0A158C440_9BURK|nr:hypothetical protein AWB75_04470 [Caballeronia catudaia]